MYVHNFLAVLQSVEKNSKALTPPRFYETNKQGWLLYYFYYFRFLWIICFFNEIRLTVHLQKFDLLFMFYLIHFLTKREGDHSHNRVKVQNLDLQKQNMCVVY